MSEKKINIIGAGISGLHAAYLLEQQGFQPVIWEASDRVGGRMKTDRIEDYQLDHGFQVLLDEYPLLKDILDFDQLDLQSLLPGAMIINKGKTAAWGDPLREPKYFWTSIFSSVSSIQDKWILFQLRRELQKNSLDQHFEEEQTTFEYLKEKGFSDKIIRNFFQPFFAGIFLEDKLDTSAAMFRFVFALFSQGNAVIPRDGIEAIPLQMLKKLKQTKIHFHTKVDQISGSKLIIEGVAQIESPQTLICTDPSTLLPQLSTDSVKWNGLDTFYFEVEKDLFNLPIIGLVPGNGFINHIFFPQSVSTQSRGKKELLSVNVVNSKGLNEDELIRAVESELKSTLNLQQFRLLKHFTIKKALPRFEKMQYKAGLEESRLIEGVYLAGDQQLYPSQNAAISSADSAVEAILRYQQ